MNEINFEELSSKDLKIKYTFSKELLQKSENMPEELYPYFNKCLDLLNDSNNIVKWAAIDIIGNLSAVDVDNKINADVVKRLFNLLHDSKAITCNHAIYALSVIAENKAQYKSEIIKEFLTIQDNDFETDECEAIATGKVLEVLASFLSEIKEDKKTIDFIKIATNSSRNLTKRKAEELLKKINN